MNLYEKYILPHIIHLVCRSETANERRSKLVPRTGGHVLEIGIGSGLNLPFYQADKVSKLTGIDPSSQLWQLNRTDTRNLGFEFDYICTSAETIPLEDASVDSILSTFTMCSIPDLPKALAEMRRVLKPGGRLFFCEHGTAPDPWVRRWQNGLNPAWKCLGGGCNLNRNIPQLLTENGFIIEELDQQYTSSPKWASFNFLGVARKA